jgi:hypothetical protein
LTPGPAVLECSGRTSVWARNVGTLVLERRFDARYTEGREDSRLHETAKKSELDAGRGIGRFGVVGNAPGALVDTVVCRDTAPHRDCNGSQRRHALVDRFRLHAWRWRYRIDDRSDYNSESPRCRSDSTWRKIADPALGFVRLALTRANGWVNSWFLPQDRRGREIRRGPSSFPCHFRSWRCRLRVRVPLYTSSARLLVLNESYCGIYLSDAGLS